VFKKDIETITQVSFTAKLRLCIEVGRSKKSYFRQSHIFRIFTFIWPKSAMIHTKEILDGIYYVLSTSHLTNNVN
jgi:hypothetical protein